MTVRRVTGGANNALYCVEAGDQRYACKLPLPPATLLIHTWTERGVTVRRVTGGANNALYCVEAGISGTLVSCV